MTNGNDIYNFAFTGAALKFHDFMRLVNFAADHQLDMERQTPDPGLIMRRSNARTNQREFQELIKRYLQLTLEQRALIVEPDANSQKHLAFLRICQAYLYSHKIFSITKCDNITFFAKDLFRLKST
jgi:hypothetical protein